MALASSLRLPVATSKRHAHCTISSLKGKYKYTSKYKYTNLMTNLTRGRAGGPGAPTWPFPPLPSPVARPWIFWSPIQKFAIFPWYLVVIRFFVVQPFQRHSYPIFVSTFFHFVVLRCCCLVFGFLLLTLYSYLISVYIPGMFMAVKLFSLVTWSFLANRHFFLYDIHLFLQSLSSLPSPLQPPSPPPARRGTFHL